MSREVARTERTRRNDSEPVVHIVTAPEEAKSFLREFVRNDEGPTRSGIIRRNAVWHESLGSGVVTVNHIGGSYELLVRVVERQNAEGLWLLVDEHRFSLKHARLGNLFLLPIGKRPISPDRKEGQVKAILAWITHGRSWIDRRGVRHVLAN